MLGFFFPQSKRSTKFVMSNAPGPGIYSLPSLLTTRKDFNRGLQGVFAAPIAEHVEKSNGIPAPNNYNVSPAIPAAFVLFDECCECWNWKYFICWVLFTT